MEPPAGAVRLAEPLKVRAYAAPMREASGATLIVASTEALSLLRLPTLVRGDSGMPLARRNDSGPRDGDTAIAFALVGAVEVLGRASQSGGADLQSQGPGCVHIGAQRQETVLPHHQVLRLTQGSHNFISQFHTPIGLRTGSLYLPELCRVLHRGFVVAVEDGVDFGSLHVDCVMQQALR